MKMAWAKWMFGLLIAAAVGYGIYISVREQPVLVDLGTVDTGPMEVAIDEEGVTRVSNVYAVSASLAGNMERITLDEGDVVARGEPIATIKPLAPPFLDRRTRTELLAAIEAARSAVAAANVDHARAQTALSLARSRHDRMSELARGNIVSDSELENALGDFQLRQAEVASAAALIDVRVAELASAQARLARPGDENGGLAGDADSCCQTLVSPIDGVVLAVKVRSEQAVNLGAVIAELGRPDDLEIAVDLLSSDAVRVAPGTVAEITDWGGDETLTAHVRRIEPAAFTKISALGIEEQRVNAVLDLDKVPAGLGHGYRVVARLVVWHENDVLQLPIAALFRDGGDWAVFVDDDGTARLRTIQLGRMNHAVAQVLSGIEDGERVVLHPSDQLSDGRMIYDRAQADR